MVLNETDLRLFIEEKRSIKKFKIIFILSSIKMSRYRKYFLELLSVLNEGKSVDSLLEKIGLKYEKHNEESKKLTKLVIKDEKDGKHFNIVYFYNPLLKKYQFLTPNKRKHLYNTDPVSLVAYAITSKKTSEIKIPKFEKRKIKESIIVFTNQKYVDRASKIYNIKIKIYDPLTCNPSTLDQLYDKGYRFFVVENANGILEWIQEHPEVKFVASNLTDNCSTSVNNLLKFKCIDEYMYTALAKSIDMPCLIVGEDKDLCSKLPGSINITKEQFLAKEYPEGFNAVFFDPSLDQAFFDQVVADENIYYWSYNTLNVSWKWPIHSIHEYYPNSNRNTKMFAHANMDEYLMVDALYLLSHYIKNGSLKASGLTGVYEFDSYNNRLWYSYVKIVLLEAAWIQNYIVEIPPILNGENRKSVLSDTNFVE